MSSSKRYCGTFYNIFVREKTLHLELSPEIIAVDNGSYLHGSSLKYYVMQVKKNHNTLPPLSKILVNDYLVAVNTMSVSSFSESFPKHEWDSNFNSIRGPLLICFFRLDDKGNDNYYPTQIPYRTPVFHVGIVYGITSMEDVAFIQNNFGINFCDDVSQSIPESLKISEESYKAILANRMYLYSQLMNSNQIYYQSINPSTSQPQVVFQIPVTQMGQYCQPVYNQNGQVIMPSYQSICSLNTGYSMNEVAKVYQSIVNWFKECVKYELLTPSVFYQNCISQIDASFYTNLRFTIDTLHSMCTKMMEDLDTQKKELHAKQLSISNSDFLCQACDTIIANLKALKAIIEKYKTVLTSNNEQPTNQKENQAVGQNVIRVNLQGKKQVKVAATNDSVNQQSNPQSNSQPNPTPAPTPNPQPNPTPTPTPTPAPNPTPNPVQTNTKATPQTNKQHIKHNTSQTTKQPKGQSNKQPSGVKRPSEKEASTSTSTIKRAKKNYSVYPIQQYKEELIRDHLHKQNDYSISASMTSTDILSSLPTLSPFTHVNMNSFTPSSSLKLPYQSTKDILYGQSDHFSIPLSQLFSVVNDFQDIAPIGTVPAIHYGEIIQPAFQVKQINHDFSFQEQPSYLTEQEKNLVKEILYQFNIINQNTERNAIIYEEENQMKRYLVYAYCIKENWLLNNKKTIIMTPTTEMIPLFQFFLNSIGGSVIPCVDSSTCDLTEFMNEEQESIQEGVVFVSCMDLLLHNEQEEGSKTRIDQIISWLLTSSSSLIVFDDCIQLSYSFYSSLQDNTSIILRELTKLQQQLPQSSILYGFTKLQLSKESLQLMCRSGLYGKKGSFSSLDLLQECLPLPNSQNDQLIKLELQSTNHYLSIPPSLQSCTFISHHVDIPSNIVPILPHVYAFWNFVYETFNTLFSIHSLYEDRYENQVVLSELELMELEHLSSAYFWDYFWLHYFLFWDMIHLTSKIPDILSISKKCLQEGKQVIVLLDSMNYNLMSFNKKKFVVYTKPPVHYKDQLSPKSYEEDEDAIFAKNYFVDPRYVIQHLIDHVIHFCKPLDRMKVTTMETIMKNSTSLYFINLVNAIEVREELLVDDLKEISIESVRSYHVSKVDHLLNMIKEKENDFKLPVSPYDMLVNQLGGMKDVAEVSERQYRLVNHIAGNIDQSTYVLRNQCKKEGKEEIDYLDKEYFFVENRGKTWSEVNALNETEWNAFLKGTKHVCIVSNASHFPYLFTQPTDNTKPFELLYVQLTKQYHQSIPLCQYIATLSSPIPCHILQSDITEQLVIHSFIADCSNYGGKLTNWNNQQLVSLTSDTCHEGWSLFLHSILHPTQIDIRHSIVLPSSCSINSNNEMDKQVIQKYNSFSTQQKIVYIRRILDSFHISELIETPLFLMKRLQGCQSSVKEIVTLFYQQVIKAIQTDRNSCCNTIQIIPSIECMKQYVERISFQNSSLNRFYYQINMNCSIQYQELMKLELTGCFMKKQSSYFFVYDKEQSVPESWNKNTVVKVRSPSYGTIAVEYVYKQLIDAGYEICEMKEDEWNSHCDNGHAVYLIPLPCLDILPLLQEHNIFHTPYHCCQLIIHDNDQQEVLIGLRLLEDDIRVVSSEM